MTLLNSLLEDNKLIAPNFKPSSVDLLDDKYSLIKGKMKRKARIMFNQIMVFCFRINPPISKNKTKAK